MDELTPVEVAEKLEKDGGSLFLLDVREDDEWQASRIDRATHIPMNEVPGRLGEIPSDRQIVVFCHHGGRSAMVAAYLESIGFDRVANLTGGIDEWSRTVDRSVPRY